MDKKNSLFPRNNMESAAWQKYFSIEKILKTGSDYINVVKKEIKNPFWNDTFAVFQMILGKLEVQSWDEFIT